MNSYRALGFDYAGLRDALGMDLEFIQGRLDQKS